MIMPIIKTQIWKIHVVINIGFDFRFRPIGKENIGKARTFHDFSLPFNHSKSNKSGIKSLYILAFQVLIRLLLASVCGTKYIPMGRAYIR